MTTFGAVVTVGSTGRVGAVKAPRWTSRARSWLSSPVTRTDLLQLLKATVAAVGAWVLAELVWELKQAYLAPWVALLTVHATVYRTMWRGLQTVITVGLGILLALVVVELFEVTAWSFGLALLMGLALSRLRVLRDEGITVATTVLLVLATGYNIPDSRAIDLLPDRLLSTAVGVVVALLVNLLVLPPLYDSSAQRQIDDVDRRLGALLVDMAQQLREPRKEQEEADWIETTRSIDTDLTEAWSLVRTAQEGRSWNPRHRLHPAQHLETYPQILVRLEEGVSLVRSIARHVRESSRASQEWDPRFRDRYIDLLENLGRRIADPDADVAEVSEDLRRLAEDLSTEDLSGLLWPLYGALIANLQVLIDVVDDVATAQPVRT
ncbi:FUSC family protein [Janibacter indicus]